MRFGRFALRENGRLVSANQSAERARLERELQAVEAELTAVELAVGRRDELREDAVSQLRRMAERHPDDRGLQWAADVAQRALERERGRRG